MKVLSGEGIKDFALLGIFQIVRGHSIFGHSFLGNNKPFLGMPINTEFLSSYFPKFDRFWGPNSFLGTFLGVLLGNP